MQITITPTDEMALVNESVLCRVREGTTAAGVRCLVPVASPVVPEGSDFTEFDAHLKEEEVVVMPPDPSRN